MFGYYHYNNYNYKNDSYKNNNNNNYDKKLHLFFKSFFEQKLRVRGLKGWL